MTDLRNKVIMRVSPRVLRSDGRSHDSPTPREPGRLTECRPGGRIPSPPVERTAMRTLLVVAAACFLAASLGLRAQQPTQTDGPRYSGAALLRPADYREWVFLSSGLGMNYNEPAPGAPPPQRQSFTNVFVNPSAWRGFMQTGTWPDRTMLVLEIRASQGDGSINKDGRFQTTLNGLEVHVKDSRFG